jgi:hypothetical protein
MAVTHARDGSGRLFVVEQPGRIRVLQPGAAGATTFLDIRGRVRHDNEQGLLGLAFHPQYATNGRFFVNFTRKSDGKMVVAEFRVSDDPDVALTASTPILATEQPFTNHKGGAIEFGPDGYLYVALGDGGPGRDPDNRAQDPETLLGKILRLDVDDPPGGGRYASPPTNPFAGGPGRDEIFALGFRNPYRFSFDRLTGELWVGDVGQAAREEIAIVGLGENHGWRLWEGTRCTQLGPNPDPGDPDPCPTAGFTFPVLDYRSDDPSSPRCAVIGGYVYRGTAGTLPAGAYVYGDFCSGEVFVLQGGISAVALADTGLAISGFGEDEAGELLVTDLNGTVFRLVAAGTPCTGGVGPSAAAFPVQGGAAALAVTAPPGCAWTATSRVPWLAITAGATGQGNGTVGITVARNATGAPRAGVVDVAGATFTATQAGAPCFPAVTPRVVRLAAAGGAAPVDVAAPAGCAWSAASGLSWLAITGAPGQGPGAVTLEAGPRPGLLPRWGLVTVAGRAVLVVQ